MEIQQCSNCFHYLKQDLKPEGFCRRFPPQIFALVVEQLGQKTTKVQSMWPLMQASSLCGEHTERPPAAGLN